jgi:hypothetical protein
MKRFLAVPESSANPFRGGDDSSSIESESRTIFDDDDTTSTNLAQAIQPVMNRTFESELLNSWPYRKERVWNGSMDSVQVSSGSIVCPKEREKRERKAQIEATQAANLLSEKMGRPIKIPAFRNQTLPVSPSGGGRHRGFSSLSKDDVISTIPPYSAKRDRRCSEGEKLRLPKSYG